MSPSSMNRRQLIQSAAAATVAGGAALASSKPGHAAPRKGRIKQSIVHWCFSSRGEKWDIKKTCSVAKELGYVSVELVSPADFGVLKAHDLKCAIVGANIQPGPPFMRGYNNPEFRPMVLKATRDAIDAAAEAGFPNVIAFTGFSAKDPTNQDGEHFSLEEGAANCVKGFKEIIGHAEKKGVNVCLEMLNTRDDSDPMKGHPGYQGDHTDYCIDIIKAVGSPRMKLLFDIYHVQVMDGDVILKLRTSGPAGRHSHCRRCEPPVTMRKQKTKAQRADTVGVVSARWAFNGRTTRDRRFTPPAKAVTALRA